MFCEERNTQLACPTNAEEAAWLGRQAASRSQDDWIFHPCTGCSESYRPVLCPDLVILNSIHTENALVSACGLQENTAGRQ